MVFLIRGKVQLCQNPLIIETTLDHSRENKYYKTQIIFSLHGDLDISLNPANRQAYKDESI